MKKYIKHENNQHTENIRKTQKLSLFILQHPEKLTNITNKQTKIIRKTQKLPLFILQHSEK